MSDQIRHLAAAYLTAVAVATVAWWVWLFSDGEAVSLFLPDGWPRSALLAFLPPDIALFVLSPVVAARLLLHRRSLWRVFAIAHAAGAIASGLWCVSVVLLTGEAWPGALAMAPPLIISPLVASLRERAS